MHKLNQSFDLSNAKGKFSTLASPREMRLPAVAQSIDFQSLQNSARSHDSQELSPRQTERVAQSDIGFVTNKMDKQNSVVVKRHAFWGRNNAKAIRAAALRQVGSNLTVQQSIKTERRDYKMIRPMIMSMEKPVSYSIVKESQVKNDFVSVI